MKQIVVLLFMITAAGRVFGQIPASSPSANRIEIVLERHVNGLWQPVDSRLVLEQNDLVRFRVRTNFSGYLYVTNLSTSGRYEVLFPTAEAGQDNKILEGRDYLIPSTSQGSFRITGPAGQEVVYWLISPGEIDNKIDN